MTTKHDEVTGKRLKELPEMEKILSDCFKFDHPKGLINAKTKKKIIITFKPTLRFDFNVHLLCSATDKPTKDL